MDLKFYFKIRDKINKKSDIFIEYFEKDKKKVVLEFDGNLDYKGYKIEDLKPNDYREYTFVSSSPKGSGTFNYTKQSITIFNFSISKKKNKKEIDNDKINKIIEKFLKNIKDVFKVTKLNKEKNIIDDIKNELNRDFVLNNKNQTIKVITFEIKDGEVNKKPFQIGKVQEKINEILSKILGKKKLKKSVTCYLCGKETQEIAINFNYIFPFYTSKKRDLTEVFLSYPVCLDCAKELYKIKDSFLLYEKINIDADIYLTLLFYDPKNPFLENYVVDFINDIANKNNNISSFHDIKNELEQLIEARSLDLNELSKVTFDILIFKKSGSEYSVKKYIPYIELDEFISIINNYEKIGKNNTINYLDFKIFLNSLKHEDNPNKSFRKIVLNLYIDFIYSLLKKRLESNSNLIRNILKLLIKRFKNQFPVFDNRIFINLRLILENMESEEITKFAYLIGKLGKIYSLTKAEEKVKRSGGDKWKEARKIFSRILLTKHYNNVKDLIKVYDYLYNKLSHLESYIPSEVEVLKKIQENLNKKVIDEVVKYYMICAFEEN